MSRPGTLITRSQSVGHFQTPRAQHQKPYPAAPREGRARSRSTIRGGDPFNESVVGLGLAPNLAKHSAAADMATNDEDMQPNCTFSDNESVAASRDAPTDRPDKRTPHSNHDRCVLSCICYPATCSLKGYGSGIVFYMTRFGGS